MKERVKFCLEWERLWELQEGYVNVAALCRQFGISRACGYKWLNRFIEADHDIQAVEERSRRPKRSPNKTDPRIVDAVIRARKMHPTWGPVTLRQWLTRRLGERDWPSPSTIGKILREHGLSRRRRRRSRVPPHTAPLAHCDGPNTVWTADFKGHFRTGDATTLYPLTIQDAHSRFLIRCEALIRPDGKASREVFESAFCEFGLPGAIRTDNGPPFASIAPGGLTPLSVWWYKLSVQHERIEPGHPEQNGRHERMHRTLKQDTCSPPRASLIAQQRAFDRFRRCYNEERPHQALDGRSPADLYESSERALPPDDPVLNYPCAEDLRVGDKQGKIRWGSRSYKLGPALAGETVALEPMGNRCWEVIFGDLILGYIDTSRRSSELIRPNRRPGPP